MSALIGPSDTRVATLLCLSDGPGIEPCTDLLQLSLFFAVFTI